MELKHKCNGCRYKSEHQEMGFMPFGVCTKETDLVQAEKNYRAEVCPYKQREEKAKNKHTKEQIIKALECCGAVDADISTCDRCPFEPKEEGKGSLGCNDELIRNALALIKQQDTEYNELYELTENYRRELGEVKADTVRKIADFIWNGESENLFIGMGGAYYGKQEFIAQIAKEI